MDDITTPGAGRNEVTSTRLVPMKIGTATVYVEASTSSRRIEASGDPSGEIRPASPPNPQEVFENASQAIRECVRVVGEKMNDIKEKVRPQQITVEFSLTFDASGKASVIPIFVTAETKVSTALKVTAVWKQDTLGTKGKSAKSNGGIDEPDDDAESDDAESDDVDSGDENAEDESTEPDAVEA